MNIIVFFTDDSITAESDLTYENLSDLIEREEKKQSKKGFNNRYLMWLRKMAELIKQPPLSTRI